LKNLNNKYFSTPYTLTEKIRWLRNNLFGPSSRHRGLTSFIPQDAAFNRIQPRIKLAFIGDIMGMERTDLGECPSVKEFIRDADFLIANFEGVISGKPKVFAAQAQSRKLLPALASLFPPERTVLSCANNHAGDFGRREFENSLSLLNDAGFLAVGHIDEPAILLDGKVNVCCCTSLSNHPASYVLHLNQAGAGFSPKARFNILYPHWGHELELFPNPAEIKRGLKLLEQWGAVLGHHPHCPQPLTKNKVIGQNKLLAFSLGSFCNGVRSDKYRHGIAAKVELGPGDDGVWRAGRVEWRFTRTQKIAGGMVDVQTDRACKYFPDLS
jgi:hypothetical protein